jgi:hypothetical protein
MTKHVCDCEIDQAGCEEEQGIWTDRCSCDAEE